MAKKREIPFDFDISERFGRLNRWLRVIQSVHEGGMPVMVTDARYAHLGNPHEPVQPEVDWTYKINQETALGSRRTVLRALFTPASAQEIKTITGKSSVPDEILDVSVIARIDCLGGERFSSSPLFNAIASWDQSGFAIAYSGKFKANPERRLPEGVRVCRVTNKLPEGVKVIGRYAHANDSHVLKGL